MKTNNKSSFYKQITNNNNNSISNNKENKIINIDIKTQNSQLQKSQLKSKFNKENQNNKKNNGIIKEVHEEDDGSYIEYNENNEISNDKNIDNSYNENNNNSNYENTNSNNLNQFDYISETESSGSIDLEEDYLDLKGNIKNAKIHANAKKILKIPEKFSPDNPVVFCNDCLLPQEKKGIVEPFPYCVDPKELQICGNGVYLFFVFHYYIIINLIGLIIICSIPYMIIDKKYADNLYKYCTEFYISEGDVNNFETKNKNCTNFLEYKFDNKDENDMTFDWINRYSGVAMLKYINVLKDFASQETIDEIVVNFNFISFITLLYLFLIHLLYVSLSSIFITENDSSIKSPNSYTVMVSDIPIKECDKDLKKYLTINDKINIHDINISYKLTKLEQLKDEYRKIERILLEINQFTEYYEEGFLCCKKKIRLESLNEQKKDIIKNIKKLNNDFSSESFTGVAFIIFNYQSEAKRYVKAFPKNFIAKCIKNSSRACLAYICCCISNKKKIEYKKKIKLTADLAPEPDDIIFEHLEFNFLQRLLRTSILFFFSILLTGISFSIVLSLNIFQIDNEKKVKNKFFLKYGLSLVISIVISIVNLLIRLLFQKFGDYEKPWTYTNKYLFTSIKLTLFTFVNSGLVPLISNVLKNGWDEHQMLLNNMFVIFICSAIISPLLSLTCFDLLLQKLILWFFITRKYTSEVTSIPLSQKQLNDYFERPDMNISFQYSFLSNLILMTFFYMPIFPLGPVITLIGVILNYFVEKFKILKIYKKPEKLNEEITYFYIDFFIITFIVWAIGNYLFFSGSHSSHFFEIFNLIFYLFVLCVPYTYLIRKFDFSSSNSKNNTISYENAFLDFIADYERLNPKTQLQGAYKYIDRLVKKEWLTKEMGEKAKEKITSTNIKTLYYFIRQTYKIENTIVRNNCKDFSLNSANIETERKNINNEETKQEENINSNYINVSMFLNNLGLISKNKAQISHIDSNVLFNSESMNEINPLFSYTYTKLSKTKFDRVNTNRINISGKNIINYNQNYNNNNNNNELSRFNIKKMKDEQSNSNLNATNEVNLYNSSKS